LLAANDIIKPNTNTITCIHDLRQLDITPPADILPGDYLWSKSP